MAAAALGLEDIGRSATERTHPSKTAKGGAPAGELPALFDVAATHDPNSFFNLAISLSTSSSVNTIGFSFRFFARSSFA